MDFVDESVPDADDLEDADAGGSREGSRRSSRLLVPTRTTERLSQAALRRRTRTTELDPVPTATGTASSSPSQMPSHPRHHKSSAPGSISSYEESLPSNLCDDVPSPLSWPNTPHPSQVAWPLEDPIDAHLFRFWVDKAAAWWDITNSHSIFKEVVPKLALSNSMLMNAIFMISAQHIQRFDPSFPARPYMYHERILQQLIPCLAESGRIGNEATLVAVILLRSFEEFHGE